MIFENLTFKTTVPDAKLALWGSRDRAAFDKRYGEGEWDRLASILNRHFAEEVNALFPGIWTQAPLDTVYFDGFWLRPEEIQRLQEVRRIRRGAVQETYTSLWEKDDARAL